MAALRCDVDGGPDLVATEIKPGRDIVDLGRGQSGRAKGCPQTRPLCQITAGCRNLDHGASDLAQDRTDGVGVADKEDRLVGLLDQGAELIGV